MLQESERTRAIRRAQHDGYAPFTVRAAVRSDRDPLWENVGRVLSVGYALTMICFAIRLGVFLALGR